jgi:hypothetical protein
VNSAGHKSKTPLEKRTLLTSSDGSDCSMRSSTPSVTTSTRVLLLTWIQFLFLNITRRGGPCRHPLQQNIEGHRAGQRPLFIYFDARHTVCRHKPPLQSCCSPGQRVCFSGCLNMIILCIWPVRCWLDAPPGGSGPSWGIPFGGSPQARYPPGIVMKRHK